MDDEPEFFRFKWMCTECKTIDDVIETLESVKQYFVEKKAQGYTIGGGIIDDYMELYPPEVEQNV